MESFGAETVPNDDLPPIDETTLRTNAWCGEPASSPAGEDYEAWGQTKVSRQVESQLLSAKPIDYSDWRDPRVGWGIILPDVNGDGKDKALALDAPECIRKLIAERSKAFAAQGGVPVFRYRADLDLGLLRRYAADGGESDPGFGGERGIGPNKVPWYLLIVGPPTDIPWRLQYRLQLDAYVGRLDLDPAGLERYVDALLSDWTGSGVKRSKPVFWAVDHGVKDITRVMRRTIAEKLAREFAQDTDKDFDMAQGVLSDEQATHVKLGGALEARHPAFVVTTSHGATLPLDDAKILAARLGLPVDVANAIMDPATLTTSWSPYGAIWYAHACCSAGCERVSSFTGAAKADSTLAKMLVALGTIGPCTAPLPKLLLGGPSPARAFVGHVEPTFDWTLRDVRNGQTLTAPIVDSFYSELHLAARPPLGYSMRVYNRGIGALWRDYYTATSEVDEHLPSEESVRRTKLVASDREAMVLLGDPTVRCGGAPGDDR
jgi:hypothetical protein